MKKKGVCGMGEDKPISLREIAQIAGVSVATVSRVIHQNGRFSKETEQFNALNS